MNLTDFDELCDRLKKWPHNDAAGALIAVAQAWAYDDYVKIYTNIFDPRNGITHESFEEVQHYITFVTGGWSENEVLIGALRDNYVISSMTWEMSWSGGLHIFKIPTNISIEEFAERSGKQIIENGL